MENYQVEQPQCTEVQAPYGLNQEENYNIDIHEGIIGYRVSIGCQSFYLSDPKSCSKIIDYYLSNKIECLKAYRSNQSKELLTKILKTSK